MLSTSRTRLLSSKFARFQNWSTIPVRLVVGYGFIAHGYAKLAKDLDDFFAILQALNVPPSHIMGWATILTEVLGGAAILSGAFVSYASIPMSAVMLVALITVHLQYGFSSIKLIAFTSAGPQFGPPGYEVPLL